MRGLLFSLALASAALARLVQREVDDFLQALVPVSKFALAHEATGIEAGAAVSRTSQFHRSAGGLTLPGQPGVVAAAIPDPNDPITSVYWVRDGCLAYDVWLNELARGNTDLRPIMDDAVHAMIRSQHVVSLSGDIFSEGLAESALNLDLTANFRWRDAHGVSGLRCALAAVMIKYADWLLTQRNGTWVADALWPSILVDLRFTHHRFNSSSFDLWWPPVWGGVYWTSALQHRALHAVARLGRKLGREIDVKDFKNRATMILEYMQACFTFWNPEEGFMAETTIRDVKQGRGGIGTAPLSLSIFNYDPELGCDAATFQPCSDRALSALKVVGDAFKKVYPIAENIPAGHPTCMGMYLEEKDAHAHPPIFVALNQAEQLYDSLHTWDRVGALNVTDTSLAFFLQFDKKVEIGSYKKGSETYEHIAAAIQQCAENALAMLIKSTPADYVLME
ncbi:glycoside hydrolase family 15 protein, partial [Auriscalpium vulgare]